MDVILPLFQAHGVGSAAAATLGPSDIFVLVSGDSDLVPAVDWIKTVAPSKQVIVYVPTRHPLRGAAVELRAAADKARNLPLELLRHSQFPQKIPDGSGGYLTKPSDW